MRQFYDKNRLIYHNETSLRHFFLNKLNMEIFYMLRIKGYI